MKRKGHLLKWKLAVTIAALVPGYVFAEPPLDPSEKRNDMTLKTALQNRKTIREFTEDSLPKFVFDEILWAAYGNTHNRGDIRMRTAPSAMGAYSIELYFALNKFGSYRNGIYCYRDDNMEHVKPGDFLDTIQAVSFGQEFVSRSNMIAFMVYHPEKIEPRVGEKARDMARLECGHIGQNILLMATAQGLGSVPKASFDKEKLGNILEIEPGDEVLYMICVGTITKDTQK